MRLRFDYPLGDLVVMAGALRELHRCHPGEFEIEVESSLQDFWRYCPHVVPVAPDPESGCVSGGLQGLNLGDRAGKISDECSKHCPSESDGRCVLNADESLYSVDPSRQIHMLESFVGFLNNHLGTQVTVETLRGEATLTAEERESAGPVEALLGRRVPYWIVCNGGKFDRTVKWWPHDNYQQVVNHLSSRVLFVQVGRTCDYHPKLDGTLDFRGWTSIRTLMRLVYWSEGVLCPITSLMHLAAAVPRPPGRMGPRPCVVVGGGIEPPHWVSYPGQRFLTRVGILPCAEHGCWKARTLSLGDGAPQDAPAHRCILIHKNHPRCMTEIRSDEVVGAISSYLADGSSGETTASDMELSKSASTILVGKALDDRDVTRPTARLAIERQVRHARRSRFSGVGPGIVTLVSGVDFVASAWVMLSLQRKLGCGLPAEVWLMGDRQWLPLLRRAFSPLDVEVRFHAGSVDPRRPRSCLFAAKTEVIVRSRFEEVLWLDADSFPARDPSNLFSEARYREHGAVFWPEPADYVSTRPEAWAMFGLAEDRLTSEVQGGELLVHKGRVAPSLSLARWCNRHHECFYSVFQGDKDIFRLAFRKMGQGYAMTEHRAILRDGCLFQVDFGGDLLFQHRVACKLRVGQPLMPVAGFVHGGSCGEFLEHFTADWAPQMSRSKSPGQQLVHEKPVAVQWVAAPGSRAR